MTSYIACTTKCNTENSELRVVHPMYIHLRIKSHLRVYSSKPFAKIDMHCVNANET